MPLRLILPVVKAWSSDDRGRLAQHDRDLVRHEFAHGRARRTRRIVPRPERRHPMAEIVLAAGVERHVGRKDAAVLSRKPIRPP